MNKNKNLNNEYKHHNCWNFEIFHDQLLPIAFSQAKNYIGNKGHIYSLPQLLSFRAQIPFDANAIWRGWFTANSEESLVKTEKGNLVLVITHGGGVLSSKKRLNKARKDLPRGQLYEEEIKGLLSGKLFNKPEIPVYSFTDFNRNSHLESENYSVVLDFDVVRQYIRNNDWGFQYNISLDKLIDNPLFIARAGGIKVAETYIARLKQVTRTYTIRIDDYLEDQIKRGLTIGTGRLLFLASLPSPGKVDLGIYGNSIDLLYQGRFLAARQTSKDHKKNNPKMPDQIDHNTELIMRKFKQKTLDQLDYETGLIISEAMHEFEEEYGH